MHFGPINSGKSTLAVAIGQARGLAVVHLDRLFHTPNSDWQARPYAEFVVLHDEAVAHASWIIEGNYSRCLPQRLARATGVILLDVSTATSLLRYFRRSCLKRDRHGGLEDGKDSVKWAMICHIMVTTRQNRSRYKEMFDQILMPKVRLLTTREIDRFYWTEGLRR